PLARGPPNGPCCSAKSLGLVYEHVVYLVEFGRAENARHVRLAVPGLLGDVLLLLRRIATNREHDRVVAALVTRIRTLWHRRIPFFGLPLALIITWRAMRFTN